MQPPPMWPPLLLPQVESRTTPNKVNVLELAEAFNVKKELVQNFVALLGAEVDVDVEDLLSIPADMVEETAKKTKKKVDEVETALSPIEAGSLIKFMKNY